MPPNEISSNQFKLTFDLIKPDKVTPDVFTKAVDGKTKRYVRGRASGTGLDLESERMAQSAILAFRKAIEDGMFLPDGRWSLIPLQAGHRTDWMGDTLGYLVSAEIDEQFDLYIVAELDDDNPNADMLWRKLTRKPEQGRPFKAGLSVGGYVTSAGEEWDEGLGRFVRVYYEVVLKEVSVVSQPAYPTAYLTALAKSVDWNKVRGRTVLVTEEQIMSELFPNTDAEATEKSVEESVVAAESAASEESEVEKDIILVSEEGAELVKAEEAVEETEVEQTETVDESAADAVEKAEEESGATGEEPAAEVAKTDPLAELRTQVESLTAQIADLTKAVSALSTTSETTESDDAQVEKAAEPAAEQVTTDAPAAEVEKAVETEESDSVVKMAGLSVEAIAQIIKNAVEDAIKPLEGRITELENEPVDKSAAFAVEKFKSESESLLARYEKEVADADGQHALRTAVKMAFR